MALKAPEFTVRRYTPETATHSHDHHQIVLPYRGGLEMEVGGEGAVVQGETFAVIPAGHFHSFGGTRNQLDDNALLIVDLPGEAGTPSLDRVWDKAEALPFVAMDEALASYCRFLAAEMERYGPSAVDRFHASTLLLEAIARRMQVAAPEMPAPLTRALRLANSPSDVPPTLDQLASEAGVSTATLNRLFLDRFGLPPARFLIRLRLEYAAKALSETTSPISEIAFQAGYRDQSAFTRAFRRELGQTPASYRDTAGKRPPKDGPL